MIAEKGSCADLHVHSKHSDRPSEWFLRRIGAPESFVEPRELYAACRERGMDFVTVTDHNSLGGSLEIADLPGTFLSSELTTYFPEDGCKVHCLVWGVTEAQFAGLQEARESLYDLRTVLLRENIAHAIAHPLFRVNDKLTAEHFEKLILMFDRFEGINGSRESRACDLANAVFRGLTPEDLAAMADRHDLEPAGPAPWIKHLTGGSDDHSGLYAAGAHTVTPRAATVEEFLGHLRAGAHEPAGRGGSSLRLAHSLYHIAHSYYRSRFLRVGQADLSVIGAILRRLSGAAQEPPARRRRGEAMRAALARPVVAAVRYVRRRRLSEVERAIVDEFMALVERNRRAETREGRPAPAPDDEQRRFDAACRIAQQLTLTFARRTVEHVQAGRVVEAVQSVSALGPILLGVAPYITAFGAQHKDEATLREIEERFPSARGTRSAEPRRAWLTDTFDDLNGVAHTIRTLAGLSAGQGRPITVVTCRPETPDAAFPLKNFTPVGSFACPEYRDQTLVVPPLLEMIAWIEEQGFDELILSTPGPVGLVGRLAGRLLGLRVKGLYHTDFPKYLLQWTDDELMEELGWRYMRWFYGGMEVVFAPSRFTLEQLAEAGFDRRRLGVLPRGIDLERFRPDRRDPDFWKGYGLNGELKFLYVGRVSEEKNLRALFEAYSRVRDGAAGATSLVIVGDGPARAELERSFRRPDVVFTGALRGDTLAAAFASADVFVFPSLTDTFGNVVLEAHASGLPAIVADRGGPPEIVGSHGSGLITEATPAALASAMRRLRDDPVLRFRLREQAMAKARDSRWETALAALDGP
jgi:glycosyltransferase involved in cell wall biosynthesis